MTVEAKNQSLVPQYSRREILRMARDGAVLFLVMGLGSLANSEPTPTKAAAIEPTIAPSKLKALAEILGPHPHFPFDQADLESVEANSKNHSNWEPVIKPDILKNTYGVNIRVMKPSLNRATLVDSQDAAVFVRPSVELFRDNFGYLYESTDAHILRELQIIAVQKPELCGFRKFDPDVSPFADLKKWLVDGITNFRTTLEQQRPTIPAIRTWNSPVNYDLSGSSIQENLKRLDGYMNEGFLKTFEPTVMFKCATNSFLGFAGGVIPEFITDNNRGNIIKGPDNIAMIRMVGRSYVALNMGDKTTQDDIDISGATPVVGGTFLHETFHEKNMFVEPPDGLSQGDMEQMHEQIFGLEGAYQTDAKAKLEQGDTSGFLFVVQSPRGDYLTKTKPVSPQSIGSFLA